jgi:RNA polymerase sigma-70 factor (ECF subfamily)
MNSMVQSPPIFFLRPVVIDYVSTLTDETAASDDSILLKRISDQDPQALREIYELYSGPVFGFLVRFLADRSTAEDVQQQVFMEVWQKAGRFDPERGSFMTWVMTIARSRAIDQARKKVPVPHDPETASRLADSASGGTDEISEFIGAWQFNQLVSELPSEESELLRYRFQGELSQSEIAKKTGIPLGTVKSRMVSGLSRLREMMEAES